jgi:DNA-binding transcriptional ArsR family regulator
METQDTLILDKPEQLKALGHPLRVRTLELLGQDPECQLTNRELAKRLGVDPGHLHFHVRMLLKAGLIEFADRCAAGREKPYKSVARTIRVHPDLLASGGAQGMQAAILEEVQRAFADFAPSGRFRSAQTTIRIPLDRAAEWIGECLQHADEYEDPEADQIVVTLFAAPPTQGRER